MEKNDFMLINDMLYQLYTETSFRQLRPLVLRLLKRIIPYSYASIISVSEKNGILTMTDPVSNPLSFQKAELEYLKMDSVDDIDHTNWILYSPETVLVRESDLMNDRSRLASPLYQQCYRHYNIFDTLQMSIVYEKQLLGVLIIYRTKEDGYFSSEDMFYLQSLSKHLNYIFYAHLVRPAVLDNSSRILELSGQYSLTRRETEILTLIFQEQNNFEILEQINISEHTLQKHIQNIYRKTGVSSRMELLKLRI